MPCAWYICVHTVYVHVLRGLKYTNESVQLRSNSVPRRLSHKLIRETAKQRQKRAAGDTHTNQGNIGSAYVA